MYYFCFICIVLFEFEPTSYSYVAPSQLCYLCVIVY
jgi:hypothetical protein